MKILILGGGGREYALAWKLRQSEKVSALYCLPGNGGISRLAECHPIELADLDRIVDFVQENGIDMTVVGGEYPLSMGIVDLFEEKGLVIIGPSKRAARIETSKAFTKMLLHKHNIPTAGFNTFSEKANALKYLQRLRLPVVIKKSGLAFGKGTRVCYTQKEATDFIKKMSRLSKDEMIVIEDYLEGQEFSYIVATDGKGVIPLSPVRDYKTLENENKGPNTGGMGAFTPVEYVTPKVEKEVLDTIIYPTIRALEAEGAPFKGILYAGLILTTDGVKVLEFNARLGDPEAQVILPGMRTDLLELFQAIYEERLEYFQLEWDEQYTVCVVLASKGYPEDYRLGDPIYGISKGEKRGNVYIFHSGTQVKKDNFFSNSGRVLNIIGRGNTLAKARQNAYKAVSDIQWESMYYRTDIGLF